MTASTNPDTSRSGSWRQTLGVYLKPRVAVMLLLGFSSGLPYQLTSSTLQTWLTDSGVSLEEIGLFGLVVIAYGWKFVWSPAIDGFAIPGLSKWLGHRRAWMLVIQLALAAAIIFMGTIDPRTDRYMLAAAAVLVAFLSASQDIVIDAFRIESLEEGELAAGTANLNAAYRIAMLLAFTGTVGIVSWAEATGADPADAWAIGYAAMGALVSVGVAGTLLAREEWASQASQFSRSAAARFQTAVIEPFRDFLSKDMWWAILLFVVLFKLGDAFTSELRTAFFLRMGFDKAVYSTLQWPFGFFSLIVGGFIGGFFVNRFGLMRSLWIAGLAQMFTNLVFIWPALQLPSLTAAIGITGVDGVQRLTFAALSAGGSLGTLAVATLGGSIALENFATGFGGVIFIAYLSRLCGHRSYTATQYALLSSLANQARIMLAAPSGFVAANLGWVWYYVIGTVLAVPGLVLLWWLWRREARRLEAERPEPGSPSS